MPLGFGMWVVYSFVLIKCKRVLCLLLGMCGHVTLLGESKTDFTNFHTDLTTVTVLAKASL